MMKKCLFIISSLMFLFLTISPLENAIAGGHWDVYNQLVVTFEDDVTETRIGEVNRSFGAEIISRIRDKTYRLRIVGDKPTSTEITGTAQKVAEMVKSYKELPEVRSAEPVNMVQLFN